MFFDFHHHHPFYKYGIYNLPLFEEPTEFPYSAGIHPQHLVEDDASAIWDWLHKVSANDNCYAIGECGLDGLISTSKELQIESFVQQIKLANELKKPLIIHCVRMFSEIISFRKKSIKPMVIHGFNKKQKVSEDLIQHNFYLSVGKAVLYNLSLQKTLESVPLDRLFIETDDADIAIEDIYEKISFIKKIPISILQDVILENLEDIKNG